jgi:endonuclease YncB( thermonuclease family)
MHKYILSLLFFISTICVLANTIEGKLINIDDGDTFTLLDQNKVQYKIRLNAIDCPEKGQEFSKKAKDFTYQFCTGKTIVAELLDTDKYGRHIANVTVNGRSLNEALLTNGLAWHYKKYNSEERLAALENIARSKRINIWSLTNPMAPWIFRHRGELELLSSLGPGQVYICQSKGAKTYHNKMCQGLSKCAKGVRQIRLSEAIQSGKKECGYCW